MSTNLKKINRLIDVKAMALKASQLILGTAIVVASSSATADLRLRDNGTVYSPSLNLTYLVIPESGLSWDAAVTHVENLVVGDATDWRLPSAGDGGIGGEPSNHGNLCGAAPAPNTCDDGAGNYTNPFIADSSKGELAWLWYAELQNSDATANTSFIDSATGALAPIRALQSATNPTFGIDRVWQAEEDASDSGKAWHAYIGANGNGSSATASKASAGANWGVIAVHDGDVGGKVALELRANGLIYDPAQDITWNTNAIENVTWTSATAIADTLVIGDATNWRLPATNGLGFYIQSLAGSKDPLPGDAELSEGRHLFYIGLGNTDCADGTDTSFPIGNAELPFGSMAIAHFIWEQPEDSGTKAWATRTGAPGVPAACGQHISRSKTATTVHDAYLVHDGDVGQAVGLQYRPGGMVYDPLQDITWLLEPMPIGNNGGVAWADAVLWADGLTNAGATEWRLPESDFQFGVPTNIPSTNELSNLFYLGLNNGVDADPTNTGFAAEIDGTPITVNFLSLGGNSRVWTGSPASESPVCMGGSTAAGCTDGWAFYVIMAGPSSVGTGSWAPSTNDSNAWKAYAVHDGDVAAALEVSIPFVPVFGAALLGLTMTATGVLVVRSRKKHIG